MTSPRSQHMRVLRQPVTRSSGERAREGEAIEASYRALPQGPEEDLAALTNAVAMAEAEPWSFETGD